MLPGAGSCEREILLSAAIAASLDRQTEVDLALAFVRSRESLNENKVWMTLTLLVNMGACAQRVSRSTSVNLMAAFWQARFCFTSHDIGRVTGGKNTGAQISVEKEAAFGVSSW